MLGVVQTPLHGGDGEWKQGSSTGRGFNAAWAQLCLESRGAVIVLLWGCWLRWVSQPGWQVPRLSQGNSLIPQVRVGLRLA